MFVIKHMVPLSMVVSWIYTVAITVQSIVYEKERRLKEFMKMMGLSNIVPTNEPTKPTNQPTHQPTNQLIN